MKYNVIGLIDLIVSNLPDDQSDLGTKINISFSELLNKFPETDVVSHENWGEASLDEACSLARSSLELILALDGMASSNDDLSDLLSNAEKIFSHQIRHSIREKVCGIYAIVDPAATNGRPVYDVVESALSGGVAIIQYRDKQNDRSVFLEQSYRIKELCEKYDGLFVVNDAADVARLSGADFLHVGQSDLPVREARKLLGNIQGIGRSNDGLKESSQSQDDGSDYLAVGAVYATSTMGKSARIPVGPDTVALVKESVDLPVVAIGGINETNLSEVRDSGADSACIVSAITMSDNPEAAAKRLVSIWDRG